MAPFGLASSRRERVSSRRAGTWTHDTSRGRGAHDVRALGIALLVLAVAAVLFACGSTTVGATTDRRQMVD
jgi:hypothetical protein